MVENRPVWSLMFELKGWYAFRVQLNQVCPIVVKMAISH